MPFSVHHTTVEGREGPIPVRDYLPENPAHPHALLWVHGGGFTRGGLDQTESDAPARYLAALGHRVRTLSYRLAPKFTLRTALNLAPHPNCYPAAHNDVLDATTDLLDTYRVPVSIGGASAGANLAAGAVLSLRDTGKDLPTTLILIYGSFHASLPPRADVEDDLRGPLAKWAFNSAMTARTNLNYVGDGALLRPGYAFPGGADLHDFPPSLVLNARNDRLRQSGDTFADELRAAGREVEHRVLEATHGFLNTPRNPAYAQGMQAIATWLTTRR